MICVSSDRYPQNVALCGDSQSTLRLLHYHSVQGKELGDNFWRAGSHADLDLLTLLFQRDGEGGLEVCPGRKVVGDFDHVNTWKNVETRSDRIVCNIDHQLMRWSDSRLKPTFHRVRLNPGRRAKGTELLDRLLQPSTQQHRDSRSRKQVSAHHRSDIHQAGFGEKETRRRSPQLVPLRA